MIKFGACVLFLLLAVSVQAQIKATTEDGREVILNKDGTWSYVEETKKKEEKKSKRKEVVTPPKIETIPCEQVVADQRNQLLGEFKGLQKRLVFSTSTAHKLSADLRLTSNGTMVWNIKLTGVKGCKEQTPTLFLHFDDDSVEELPVATDFICDDEISIYLVNKRNNKSLFKSLRTKQITRLEIESRRGRISQPVVEEESRVLYSAVGCLLGKK